MKFACLPVTELSMMLKNLTHGTIPENVAFPYLPCLCLCWFCVWNDYHLMYRQEPDASSYIGTVMDCWTEHMMDLTNATESAKDDVKSPPGLMKLTDWEMHSEQWLNFLAERHNLTTGVPLIYILWSQWMSLQKTWPNPTLPSMMTSFQP